MKNINPVFILGAPRSGTTFLASLLGETEYGGPYETHFIPKYFRKVSKYGDLNQLSNFKRLVNDILSERPIMQLNLNLDIDVMFNELERNREFATIANYICYFKNRQQGLTSWGDKTPWYITELPLLLELYPAAKFVYIVRDGRDVAFSLLQKIWGPNNIWACAQLWQQYNQQHQALIQELIQSGQCLYVRYEDILANIQPELTRIYAFLETDINKETIEKYSKSMMKNNALKWKKNFTPEQIQVFDEVAKDALVEHGYEVTSSPKSISFIQKIRFQLHETVCRAWYLFHLNVIDGFKIKFLGKPPFGE